MPERRDGEGRPLCFLRRSHHLSSKTIPACQANGRPLGSTSAASSQLLTRLSSKTIPAFPGHLLNRLF